MGLPIQGNPRMIKYLDRQVGKDKPSKAMTKVAAAIKVTLEFMAGAGPLFSYLFGFGFSNLWPMIEAM